MQQILSEQFGLYQIEVGEKETGFFYDIECLDEDGTCFGEHYSTAQSYELAFDAFRAGMIRLASLFWQDLEDAMETKTPTNEGAQLTGAGKGTRTPDILLGKKSVAVKPSELEVQS